MDKITVSVTETQHDRLKRRVENNVAENRSEALRQEIEQTNNKSPRRKQLDIAANSLGTVGILMIGFTFFMSDSIRVLSLVPIIGSTVLFTLGYVIDERMHWKLRSVIHQ